MDRFFGVTLLAADPSGIIGRHQHLFDNVIHRCCEPDVPGSRRIPCRRLCRHSSSDSNRHSHHGAMSAGRRLPRYGAECLFRLWACARTGFSWQQALAAVFVASVLFLLFSLSRLRSWLIGAILASLRLGITAGIGLFLAMIGLQGMGLVVDDPDTLLRLGNLGSPAVLLSLAGLLVMAGLAARGMRGGILLTILGLSLVGWLGDCRIWWHCRGTTGRQRGLCAGFLGRDKRRLSVGGLYSVLSGFLRYHRHIDRNRRYCRQETRRWQHRESGPCRGSGYGRICCWQPARHLQHDHLP